jgi:molecular chaperone DnaJ
VGDIFSQFFGGGQRGPDNRGDDLRYDVTLTLEEAYKGIKKEIVIPRDGSCEKCSGSGAAEGGIARTCNTCRGQGMVQKMVRRGFMSTVSTIECNDCKGSGKTVDKPCNDCRGSGIMPVKKKIKLQIPPGADHGYKLRMRSQGGAGPNNGPKGDLYIVVNVKKHDIFQRQDNEIILDLEITPAQAVIGDGLRIPTLSGNVKLKIPSGTQSGDVLRLKGKGMPDISRPSLVGSQHIRINVKVPKPNGKTRKLWEELRELDSEKPSFLDRIMDKFG